MADYPIGWGKPPRGRPFPPGQSGNPNGRPKQTNDLGEIVEKTLNAQMSYRENGNTKVASRREVAIKLLVEKAKNGDVDAAEVILKKRNHALRRGRKSALQFVVTDWLPDPVAQQSDHGAQDLPTEIRELSQGESEGDQGGQGKGEDVPPQGEGV